MKKKKKNKVGFPVCKKAIELYGIYVSGNSKMCFVVYRDLS